VHVTRDEAGRVAGRGLSASWLALLIITRSHCDLRRCSSGKPTYRGPPRAPPPGITRLDRRVSFRLLNTPIAGARQLRNSFVS
jgi:hypothetical protein